MEISPRMQRGLTILELENQVKRLDSETYRVKSQSGNGSYLVIKGESEWRCECPDHVFRGEMCKHIHAVSLSLILRKNLASTDVNISSEKPDDCKVCGSSNIIRSGLRQNKSGKLQRFLCKDCGYRFVLEVDGFQKAKTDPKTITTALDLYFKGLSMRKIVDHLRLNLGRNFHHTTILKWINKYTDLVKGYVDKLTPEVSGMWHVDEMKVNSNGKLVWLWNLMDEDTRFMLASQISNTREVMDARRVLREAKARANSKPDYIVTDGLQSYRDAITKEFFTLRKPRTEHIRAPGLKARINNNIVERLQGTVRERNKVMRGLNSNTTGQKFMDGQRIYYNFIRPHMSLKGKTPAEVAKVKLRLGQNRWLDLIKQSARESREHRFEGSVDP